MPDSKSANLPEEYESDPWTAVFICELYDLYGIAVSGPACMTKADKIQYLWATIGISNALSKEEPMWRAMRNRVQPKEAAEEFARRYYNLRNKMVIEGAPSFLDRILPAKDGAVKAITSDREK